MTAAASSRPNRLVVVLDIRLPFSYLALRPTFDLIEEAGVQAEWLPIRALTLAPPRPAGPDADRGIRHRRFRAEMIAREIQVYADAQGLTIDSPYRDGHADAVHLAWLWLLDVAPTRFRAFIEEAFRRYWALKLDPESLAQLLSLLDDLELDAARFAEWARSEGPAALSATRARVAELGVLQAPGYVLEDQVFLGRQHLPMIRWLLGGGSGEIPI